MSAHTVSITPVPDDRYTGPLFFRWSCSCGSSSDTLHGSEGQAERAHTDHVQAKNGN